MADERAKAERIVPGGPESGPGRESVVEAVVADLRTAAANAVAFEDRLASLQAQTLALCDAVEAVAETAASVVSNIQAVEDRRWSDSAHMTGPMPTRVGDVVVWCTDSDPAKCTLWQAEADTQQVPEPGAHVSTVHGSDAALTLARMMVRESRGAIFLFNRDALMWTRPSE